jgi:hypothetical protein
MENGTWVQWTPPAFGNVEAFTPVRGWVVASEGGWIVVRCSHMRAPHAPYHTFNVKDVEVIQPLELVHGGARLIA